MSDVPKPLIVELRNRLCVLACGGVPLTVITLVYYRESSRVGIPPQVVPIFLLGMVIMVCCLRLFDRLTDVRTSAKVSSIGKTTASQSPQHQRIRGKTGVG